MKGFIHKLLQLQIEQNGYENLVFSPLSLEMLLGLVLPGTQGKSREELLVALEITEEEVNSYLAELKTASDSLLGIQSDVSEEEEKDEQRHTKVQLANSLWHKKNTQPNPNYERTISTRFPFELFQFSDPVEDTLERINQWSNEKTNGLIPALPMHLSEDSVAVLLSALYLKAFWSREFRPQEDDIFYTLNGSETSSQYMYIRQDQIAGDANAQYLKKEQFHALRLMFNDKRIGLEVYLPYENTGLPTFIQNLQPGDFDNWQEDYKQAPYFYFLMPKFEISGGFKISKIADSLGLTSLLKPSGDLRPMLKSKQPLNFDEIGQEAKIKVVEEGLEAAAVSFGVAVAAGMSQQSNPMIIFEADHPFLYRVVDVVTNQCLFQGIFTTPVHAPNAFVQHLNKRLYKVYEDKTDNLSDKERFVMGLVLLELLLKERPLEYYFPPNLISKIWKGLANQSNHSLVELSQEYTNNLNVLYNLMHEANENLYANPRIKENESQQYEAMEWFANLFVNENYKDAHHHGNLIALVGSLMSLDIQLPNYNHLENLIKQKQVDGYFKRIRLSSLKFDEVPTEITYTEEEKQEKAEAKAAFEAYERQRALAQKLEAVHERVKIGISAYLITKLRSQLGENYTLMDDLLAKLWLFLANQDDGLKHEAARVSIWIINSDGFETLPGSDAKAKIYLRLLRKKYPVIVQAVRVLLSQLIEESWEWNYQSIAKFTLFFEEHSLPIPDIEAFTKIITESIGNDQNLVLDYTFFDQIAEAIQSTQTDLDSLIK